MNIVFMRHGEAVDNVKGVLSCKEVQCSALTEKGAVQVAESVRKLPRAIDKIYSSPLIRTLQTTKEVLRVLGEIEVKVDSRIREIDWGEFNGECNNSELDAVRTAQLQGDFFVRFGLYGDNKYSLESRLSDFLNDIQKHNFKNNTILVVSHGTVISFMKRILGLRQSHAKKGEFELFEDVDFSRLDEYRKRLEDVKNSSIANRLQLAKDIPSSTLRCTFMNLAEDFNNIELSDDILAKVIGGYNDKLTLVAGGDVLKNNGLIVICLFKNMGNFIDKWFSHYVNLGARRFVFLDNNSTDDSVDKIDNLSRKYGVGADIWSVPIEYNCFRSCGWRQQIMDIYGTERWYLNVDSDELFVFSDTNLDIGEYVKHRLSRGITVVKSMMIDVYSNKPIFDNDNIEDFQFFDVCGYKKTSHDSYGERIYGGPRNRVFGIKPSLQKVPLLYYTGSEALVNDHFIIPWVKNPKAVSSVLLHYKFLPGSLKAYKEMAKSGIHWNHSKEYKRYIQLYKDNPQATFYLEGVSRPMKEFSLDYFI